MTTSTRARYDTVAIVIHWLAAVLMIFMVVFGEELMEVEEESEAASTALSFLPSLHVSLGTAILVLTVFRLLWRVINPPPHLPATMKGWEIAVTRAVHGLFYVLLVGIPVTGWLATPEFLREEGVASALHIFGVFPLPAAPNVGEAPEELHEIGSKIAMVLIILHVLAALKHQFINRDGLLARMSPH